MGRAGKALKTLRALFYLAVILGVAFYVLDLYATRGGWRAELAGPPRLEPVGPTSLRVEATLDVYNPSHSRVEAKLVWYTVKLNGYYVGEGFKPYIVLEPGHNRVRLSTTLDVARLPCGVAAALARGRAEVSIEGYAIVTIELFGRIGYRDIVVPINATRTLAAFNPGPLRPALRGLEALCAAIEKGGAPIPLP